MLSEQKSAAGEGVRGDNAVRSPPVISLPKGGGAIRGIGEKFGANPVTGTGSMTVPIATSPSRSGFGPQLALSYDSGAGNGPFAFGWSLSLPSITRKTDKGLPKYEDAIESDLFLLSGAEDLVPRLVKKGDKWTSEKLPPRNVNGVDYRIQRYRPRIEGLFARIERWTNLADATDVFWRSISKDNITTCYGKTAQSRIADPTDPSRIFGWLICQSYDDKGNAIIYEYKAEDSEGVDVSQVHERNRNASTRSANRYLKRIKYGNRAPNRDADWRATDPALLSNWMFEVVFDYGEGHFQELPSADGHSIASASLNSAGPATWAARQDQFSSYRAGFEVRTCRLCQRVLMFHHFPGELNTDDYLVGSTEFTYQQSPIATFIMSIARSGYSRREDGSYLKKSLPPIEFEYSQADIDEEIREVDGDSLANLPIGLHGADYQWIDLDGEGVPGVLTEQADSWFYKRNISPISAEPANGHERLLARFQAVESVSRQPTTVAASGEHYQFLDLAGDGKLDLVELTSVAAGFYERTDDKEWDSFRAFPSQPNIAWADPNLRFIDLTGDGHADALITEDEVFTWYPSLAEEGFGPAETVRQLRDEEQGPHLVFADETESIYLADMSGDGLTDFVRIRNGELCYWPNLGYGRFGRKVTTSVLFDYPDQFDQKRIRLADIDGSGTTDIIYLGRDRVNIYRNQAGNGWSDPESLTTFPPVDNLAAIQAIDLLGNGTACLVWSSPLPGNARRPMRYIDLMGGQKPHLLIRTVNNLGAERRIHYAPSTKFYLEDELAGNPWITRLPFPIHVVERVETYDQVSRSYFATRYAYHHGYFDGDEREFRGFGMVEQFDTEEFGTLSESAEFPIRENIDAASHVPPVLTKTWFHTGVYLGRDHVSDFFAGLLDENDRGEYYRAPGLNDEQAKKLLLDDSVLPAGLTLEEEREACRALKGAMLRQEVYGLDGTDKEKHPYTVTEQNFTIERLQSRNGNRHAVFFTHSREALTYHYERNPDDPRVGHALTLEVDEYGNLLKSVSIGYGRTQSPLDEQADRHQQTQTLITYVENSFTNPIDDLTSFPDTHRAALPSEARTFELTGYTPAGTVGRFQSSDFVQADPSDPDGRKQIHIFDSEVAYQEPTTANRQRRIIEHVRSLYRRDALNGLLPLGQLESLALAGESYKLAFTPGLLADIYKRTLAPAPEENLLPVPAQVLGGTGADQGGYLNSQDLRSQNLFPSDPSAPLWTRGDSDDHWWIASGPIFYSASADVANPSATAAAELTDARQHFFAPRKFTDPFGHSSTVEYDTHDLLIVKTEDPLQNTMTALHDYRVLQPRQITDPNGNRSRAVYDTLGMVAGTAVMGKAAGPDEGDSLDTFIADLTPAQIAAYFDAQNPRLLAQEHLGSATTRIIYDLDRVPACAGSIARETHVSDLGEGEQTKVQLSFVYSDGFGHEAQTKIQAEPGPLEPNGSPILDPRWVGSGAKVSNNKGKAVRQFEPFFSATHHFGIEQHGVSSTLFYDPAERVIATLHPNHTWEKVVFDPWQQTTYDVNDTVLNADDSTDPKSDEDVKGFFSRLPDADYLPTWYEQRLGLAADDPERVAADKAAIHRQTPTVSHLDTLGRPFLTIAHNRFVRSNAIIEEKYPTRIELDIEGNQRAVRDAIVQNGDAPGRIVMRYDYDMLGNRIHQASMEAGERWVLNDVTGKPIRAWDSRGHTFRTEYDELRRRVGAFVRGADLQDPGKEILFGRTEYGDDQPNATQLNLRTRVFRQFDGAGMVTNEEYSFKDNLLRSSRQLAADYKTRPDWSTGPALEPEVFTGSTTYDALNRPVTLTTPDHSVIRPTYNEANLLEKVQVNLRGASAATTFVEDIDYNAKGQRELIRYGNGVTTIYEYDLLTLRLMHLETMRSGTALQDLRYTYDPAGNITFIRDDAQQTVYFNNAVVESHADYTYDAIYRLVSATGREHIGQLSQPQPDWNDEFRANLPHPHDGQAMRGYTEQFDYDEVGNILGIIHQAANGNWTRSYAYNDPSLIEPGNPNNRLSSTTVGATTETYFHDAHGNMIHMPHLAQMDWDFKDQLQAVNLGGGGKAHYIYDAAGQRTRKVLEKSPGLIEERIYLGGVEIFRRRNGSNNITLERETLHIMDDKQRIALVETRTQGSDGSPAQLIRYQFSNHLGSASLELDATGQIISYEEYYPYGNTSYQAVRGGVEVSPKRYRYTGKERDEETGLYYHRARYYASWLGRWTGCDPAGLTDGSNLYAYLLGNPVRLVDPDGTQSCDPEIASCITEPEPPEKQLCDVDPDTLASEIPPAQGAKETPTKGPEVPLSAVAYAWRKGLSLAANPVDISGVPLEGTYYLWSGKEGKESAKASMAEKGGWMMGQTPQHQMAEQKFAAALADEAAKKFPGKVFSQAELFGMAGKELVLPDEVMQGIWDPPSRDLAIRAALSEMPVDPHGLPGPKSVQARVELPAVQWSGSGVGLLMIGSGGVSIYSGTEQRSSTLGMLGITAGISEVTGGIIFGSGSVLVNAELMAIGSGLADVGGGVGAGVAATGISLEVTRALVDEQVSPKCEPEEKFGNWIYSVFNGMRLGAGMSGSSF